jgi:hypothetical protein
MALILPPDMILFDDVSEGEREVFHFLRNSARPDKYFVCWYRPSFRGDEPDFVLLSKKQGLLVIEVKDWAIHQIKEADPHTIKVFISGNYNNRTDPDR